MLGFNCSYAFVVITICCVGGLWIVWVVWGFGVGFWGGELLGWGGVVCLWVVCDFGWFVILGDSLGLGVGDFVVFGWVSWCFVG